MAGKRWRQRCWNTSAAGFISGRTTYERRAIMAIQIGNYNFDGPHGHTSNIHNSSGVYVILGRNGA